MSTHLVERHVIRPRIGQRAGAGIVGTIRTAHTSPPSETSWGDELVAVVALIGRVVGRIDNRARIIDDRAGAVDILTTRTPKHSLLLPV